MFVCDIGTGGIHAGSHEFIGCVGGFSPMDVGQRTASLFQEEIDNGGVVRKQAELFAQGSCGIADVDADKAVVRQNPVTFLPGAVQNVVHFTISCGIVFSLEIFPDFGILGKKDFVPHLNHRIGRRGDDELHGSVGNKGQIRRRRIYDFVKTLHYWDLPSVFRAFCHICGRSVLSLCCIEAGSQDPLRIPAKRTGIFCSLLCRGRQSILRQGKEGFPPVRAADFGVKL